MYAIISHDIDHLTASEHYLRDLIVPKFLARTHLEHFKGKIEWKELTARYHSLITNRWNHLDELMEYNQQMGIPSSFFMAVKRGMGIAYSDQSIQTTLTKLQNRKVEIGVHGIDMTSSEDILSEHTQFKQYTQLSSFGIRMHYIRSNPSLLEWMNQSEYRYDSSEFAFKAPYKIGSMWEFPVQIMDSWVMEQKHRYQFADLDLAKDYTLQQIAHAEELGLPFLNIIFHDRYFEKGFQTWRSWYEWLTHYLRDRGVKFVNFNEAITLLEKGN